MENGEILDLTVCKQVRTPEHTETMERESIKLPKLSSVVVLGVVVVMIHLVLYNQNMQGHTSINIFLTFDFNLKA